MLDFGILSLQLFSSSMLNSLTQSLLQIANHADRRAYDV